jgi:hypothetical protein
MGLLTRLGAAVALLTNVLVVGAAGCGATADGTPLFREPPRQPAAPLPASPRILRSRYVAVDFDALGGVGATTASAPATLLLNLFPDATFTAERDRVEPTSSGHGMTWVGHLRGVAGSSVTLVAEDGVLAGTISGGGHAYNVSYVGDGVHVIHEVDPGAFPPD